METNNTGSSSAEREITMDFNKICRICFNEDQKMWSLFEHSDNTDTSLAQKLALIVEVSTFVELNKRRLGILLTGHHIMALVPTH